MSEWAGQLVVAGDGSGSHRSIQDAIDAVPVHQDGPWLIEVRAGTYEETIRIAPNQPRMVLRGEEATATTITGRKGAHDLGPDGKPLGTFRTPTFFADADDLTIENLTIANTAGTVGQAVALSVSGDRVTVRKCRLNGWQDTLYVARGRHYFDQCFIEGHCDFIFGAATSVFDLCTIHSLTANYITAASTPAEQEFGLVFFDCDFTSDVETPTTYLGRPWRDHAATALIRCKLGRHVHPEGWHNWSRANREKTARYVEHACTGPGAARGERVPWSHLLRDDEAKEVMMESILMCDERWNPKS